MLWRARDMRHSTKTFYIIISWLLNTTDYTSSGHLSRGTSVSLMYITPMLLYSLIPIDETVLTSTTYCTQVCRTSPSGKEQADPKNACKGHPQSLPVLPNLSPPLPPISSNSWADRIHLWVPKSGETHPQSAPPRRYMYPNKAPRCESPESPARSP